MRLFSIGSDGGFTEYERSAFETDHEEAVLEEWLASNPDGILEDGRILIIGRQVRTDLGGFIDLLGVDREGSVASFLGSKGLRVTCVEFSLFRADGGGRLLSHDVVVGREHVKPRRVVSGSQPVVSEAEFLQSCDEQGRSFFLRLFEMARAQSLPIVWGSKRFSLNVDVDGTRVYLGHGDPEGRLVVRRRLLERKSAAPTGELETLWAEADASGVFRRGGYEPANLVCGKGLADVELKTVLGWFGRPQNEQRCRCRPRLSSFCALKLDNQRTWPSH